MNSCSGELRVSCCSFSSRYHCLSGRHTYDTVDALTGKSVKVSVPMPLRRAHLPTSHFNGDSLDRIRRSHWQPTGLSVLTLLA
jgi:hypothetical protein